MARFRMLMLCAAAALQASADSLSYGPSSYAPSGTFPTQWYSSYYNDPTATTAQPQPIISDSVLHKVYPPELTDPNKIPQNDTQDPHLLPLRAPDEYLLQAAVTQVEWLLTNDVFANDTCTLCNAVLQIGKFLSLAAPEKASAYFVLACEALKLFDDCPSQFGPTTYGPLLAQVTANADVAGYDGQMLCRLLPTASCPLPPTPPLNLTNWFSKPKPNPLPPSKKPSGQRLKVLHLSDFHIDPRYATGSEANCSEPLCCRADGFNSNSPNKTLVSAPRYGSFFCDAPFSLVAAVLEAIPILAATNDTGFAWTLFTGDVAARDPENELSRDYVTYTETVMYDLFKRTLGPAPVYVTLGNHDTYNQAQDAPHSLGGALAEQFSWNYDHVAGLWKLEQWLPDNVVDQARSHYGGYSVQRTDGLRIISINTDFWYRANLLNYINLAQADNSGMLRFLTDELQDAEDKGDRVWIIGHVPSGWNGIDALPSTTNLFYQIVDRYSPHVLANIFFGHTHSDQLSIFYANNATNIGADTALTISWIAPSITPIHNLNSGFRVYEIDSGSFEILDAHTWRSDVSAYPGLDGQTTFGPTFVHEYSTRDAYGSNITWGKDDPLNATWWHLVTEQMESNPNLVATFNDFQSKQSVRSSNCTGDCIAQTICYMRSGSASLSIQNCAGS